jgi:predicted acyl esterase
MRQALVLFALTLTLAPPPAAWAQATPTPPAVDSQVDLRWGVKIPLRDGVQLNATLYLPHGQSAALPAIFTLTPYIGDSYHARAIYFARNGYGYLLVDARGRGNSGGAFEPFAHEAKDGADVVEWLARQPWCNGKVAMWGGSYAGYDQWATAKEFPAHLVTIVPAAAVHPAVDFPFQNGVFYSYDIQWLTFTSGVTANANLFGDESVWRAKFHELYVHHVPFATLDSIVGNRSSAWRTWLAHPSARYRDSTGAATPLRAGEITHFDFSSFGWFSRRIARGSRLRLVITCPNSIYLEKNYGAGGVVAEESGRDGHVTHVALYHDRAHPSYVEIPIAAAP